MEHMGEYQTLSIHINIIKLILVHYVQNQKLLFEKLSMSASSHKNHDFGLASF